MSWTKEKIKSVSRIKKLPNNIKILALSNLLSLLKSKKSHPAIQLNKEFPLPT